MNIQVRLEGNSQDALRTAAQEMGVTITRIYQKRNRNGYLAYGYKPQLQRPNIRTYTLSPTRQPAF